MSTQAEDRKPAAAQEPLLHRLFVTFPRRMWTIVSHNLQWKILALVMAIFLWVGLILQDPSLTRERVFSNVPLTITGSDILRRNGFIVTQGLEESNAIVKLKADVPQHEYNDVTYVNYSPRIDLSRITEAGEQTVKVSTTSSSLYGSVTDVFPAEIPVMVDTYITNFRIPVQVEVTGAYPDGFYGTLPIPDVATITVSGPESLVAKIARVVLEYNVSKLPARESTVQTALPLHYRDIDGNEIDPALIEPTSGGVLLRSIVLEQKLYPMKTLALNQSELITGTPRKGYEVKGVSLSPSVIIAAGDETTLSTLNTLFTAQAVDVSDASESFTAQVAISRPENIVYMNADTVMLVVDIGPVLVTKTYDELPLTIADTPEGMAADCETKSVAVSVTGPELAMESIRSSRLSAFVSAKGLREGTFDLPLDLSINADDPSLFTFTITPQSVAVTLSAK